MQRSLISTVAIAFVLSFTALPTYADGPTASAATATDLGAISPTACGSRKPRPGVVYPCGAVVDTGQCEWDGTSKVEAGDTKCPYICHVAGVPITTIQIAADTDCSVIKEATE